MVIPNRIICYTPTRIGRKWMEKQANKRKTKVEFFKGDLHDIRKAKDKRLSSHLKIISQSAINILKNKMITKRDESIMIIEDDIQFTRPPYQLPTDNLPKNNDDEWDILLLYGEYEVKVTNNKYWNEVTKVKEPKAYIVNSRCYGKLLTHSKNKKDSYEEFWNTLQLEGNEGLKVYSLKSNYSVIVSKGYVSSVNKLDSVPITNGIMELKDIPREDLPFVSVITPVNATVVSTSAFFILCMSFFKQSYPRDKLEWIIVDDTDTVDDQGKTEIQKILPPEETRIKYVRCNVKGGSKLSMGKKLNTGIDYMKENSNIICHFYTNGIYPKNSILSRVTTLLNYSDKDKKCVGCTTIGTYNLFNNSSYSHTETDKQGHETVIQESTMMYTKSFWEVSNFAETLKNDNIWNVISIPFIINRYDQVITMDYTVVGINVEYRKNKVRDEGIKGFQFIEIYGTSILESLKIVKDEITS